jgi:hypothetical protein
MTALRIGALLACVGTWLWLWSIHTPWATDLAPRLWLYDLLFYVRVALVAWTLAECALWCWHPAQRGRLATLLLGSTLLAGLAGWMYARSGIGWKWRVAASAPTLDALATQAAGDSRQRAGHVLVDTMRFPCDGSTPWFWLGRPHGAGSGINLAIVRSDTLPQAPFAASFRLRRIDGQWWMAYQHGARYQTMQGDRVAATCATPRQAASHRAGLAFIEAGG